MAIAAENIGKPGGEYAWKPNKTNPKLNTHRASGMPSIGADTGSMPITSTNVSVWCNGSRVGVIKSMSVSESRTNTKLQELGTEGVVQIVPGNTNGGQLRISRFALYNSSLFNALGLTRDGEFNPRSDNMWDEFSNGDPVYHTPIETSFSSPFKTLKDQRVPIEIQTKTQMHGDKRAFYIETYIDCWLASYGKTISANDITITEDASIEYSDVIATYKEENESNKSNNNNSTNS